MIDELKADARSTMLVFQKLLRLRQVAAHPRLVDHRVSLRNSSGKFEALADLLDDALEEQHKVLIFSQWSQMASQFREHLASLEETRSHLYLDGGVHLGIEAASSRRFRSRTAHASWW